jgi:RNA polymerase sigma-70 factor (ECF subfamily)
VGVVSKLPYYQTKTVGTHADFDALYRIFAPKIRALAIRRLADTHEAQDVVQETFLKALKSIDTVDRRKPIWPWLSKIGVNLCRDVLRNRLMSPELMLPEDELIDQADAKGDPADQLLVRERVGAVSEALDHIYARYRRVFTLKEVEGWRCEEIATMEGITTDTLKSLSKRARQSFRGAYEKVAQERDLRAIFLPVFSPLAARIRAKAAAIQAQIADAIRFMSTAASFENLRNLFGSLAVVGTIVAVAMPPHVATASQASLLPKASSPAAQPARWRSDNYSAGAIAGSAASPKHTSVANVSPKVPLVGGSATVDKGTDDKGHRRLDSNLYAGAGDTNTISVGANGVTVEMDCEGSIALGVICPIYDQAQPPAS